MLYRPLIGEGLSGSLGGITALHGKGGPAFRVRGVPTNPSTVFQEAVRQATRDLTVGWNDTLTQAQRDAWDVYAENVPLTNPLGEARSIPGLSQYVRSNVPRLQSGLARVDAAPTVFNLGSFTQPVIASITAPSALSLTFTNGDAWAGETGSSMLIYTSRPQNPSIKYFTNPYRFAGMIDGDDTTPPTSPAAITLAFPAVAGNQVFIRLRVTRLDGRLSADFRDVDVVV